MFGNVPNQIPILLTVMRLRGNPSPLRIPPSMSTTRSTYTCFPWCILQVSFYIYLFILFLYALMSLCNCRSKGLWRLKNGTGLSKFFVSHCLLLLESILGNYKKYFLHIFLILKLFLLVSSLSYELFYFKLWSAQSSFTRNILKANYNYFWCCWEHNLFNNWVNLE